MSDPKYNLGDIIEYSGPGCWKREVLKIEKRGDEYFYFVDSYWWIPEKYIQGKVENEESRTV